MEVDKIDTVLCADCVAWCPHPDASDLLVCSTYELVDQRRHGSILLFSTKPGVNHLQTLVNLPGVFDCQWSPPGHATAPTLAVADSTGTVSLLQLDTSRRLLPTAETSAGDAMALYVDWHDNSLAVSLSDGHVAELAVTPDGIRSVQSTKTHELEAWTAVFDATEPQLVYSGGDDRLLALTDLRSGSVILRNRYHGAGVTHILSLPKDPGFFFSGSYDENICRWDRRQPRAPIHQLSLGGGVWRLHAAIHSGEKVQLATACMFAGFKFLEFDPSQGFQELGGFRTDEGCLAYGVSLALDNDRLAACTFYDRTLQISQVSPFTGFAK